MTDDAWGDVAGWLTTELGEDSVGGCCWWCDLQSNASCGPTDAERLALVSAYWDVLKNSPFVDKLRAWKLNVEQAPPSK